MKNRTNANQDDILFDELISSATEIVGKNNYEKLNAAETDNLDEDITKLIKKTLNNNQIKSIVAQEPLMIRGSSIDQLLLEMENESESKSENENKNEETKNTEQPESVIINKEETTETEENKQNITEDEEKTNSKNQENNVNTSEQINHIKIPTRLNILKIPHQVPRPIPEIVVTGATPSNESVTKKSRSENVYHQLKKVAVKFTETQSEREDSSQLDSERSDTEGTLVETDNEGSSMESGERSRKKKRRSSMRIGKELIQDVKLRERASPPRADIKDKRSSVNAIKNQLHSKFAESSHSPEPIKRTPDTKPEFPTLKDRRNILIEKLNPNQFKNASLSTKLVESEIQNREERSSSLPYAIIISPEDKERLLNMIHSESTMKKLIQRANNIEKQTIQFFLETERFVNLAHATDPIVANNMIQSICKTFTQEEIPQIILKKLQKRLNLKLTDLNSDVQLFTELKDQALDYIFLNLIPRLDKTNLKHTSKSQKFDRKLIKKSLNLSEEVDCPENIRYLDTAEGNIIVAATTERLVYHLTADTTIDHNLAFTFLLTFRYFIPNNEDLLELLMNRFAFVLNSASNKKEPAVIKILLKIVNILKQWADIHRDHFHPSTKLHTNLQQFITNQIEPILPSAAQNLKSYVELKAADEIEEVELQYSGKPPKPKKLKKAVSNVKDMRVEYISTLELARQIALVDHKLYRAIKIGEVLYMNWTKEKTKHEKSANVLKMINQFNRIGQWVISSLVTTQNDDKRCKLLQKFISVANESFKLRNLNGAMAIISGLKNSNIARLKRTWNAMPSSSWDEWEEINGVLVLDDNFATLRKVLQESPPPSIPYLGMYLSDLTFKDVEQNFIDDQLVNFSKMRALAGIISKIKDGQTTPYCLDSVPIIQEFITSVESIPEKEYYVYSNLCEQKEQAGIPISRRSSSPITQSPSRRKTLFSIQKPK